MKKQKNYNMYTMPSTPMMTRPRYPYRNPESMMPIDQEPPVEERPVGPPVYSEAYLQGYLKTQIGKFMRVDFVIGTGTFIDKEGILISVGIDHIVLKETTTDSNLICDLYSIKFVTIPK